MSKVIYVGDADITESVQILYDIAHSSLDWGSGFLDNAEMEAVIGSSVAKKFPQHYEVIEQSNGYVKIKAVRPA